MDRLQSLFIATWTFLLAAGFMRSAYVINSEANSSSWYWALMGMTIPLIFLAWVFIGKIVRTKAAANAVFILTLLATLGAVFSPGPTFEATVWILAAGVIGAGIYQWWFARFEKRISTLLKVGKTLPPLELINYDGTRFKIRDVKKPMLIIFYRGNWCSQCMAQITNVAEQYGDLAEKGVEIVLISPQPQSHTALLAESFKVPMTFLVDRDNAMAKRLGIAVKNGLPSVAKSLGYGRDTVIPTTIMTDARGNILFADLAGNYRVRPAPKTFLQVFAQADI